MCKSFYKIPTLLVVLIAVSALVGCGKSDGNKAATQTVAKVNDAEITMHQVNLMLKGVQNVTAENVDAIRKQALEKLIDQQILVEKANKESLDRTPEVIMAMEAAKKEVLANAYLQKLVANSPQINDTEVKKYYKEHPGLFSKRRIYTFDDIGLEKNDAVLPTLKEDVGQKKSLPEIGAWLKENGVKYSGGSYTRPAEQIPLTMLPKLESAREGDTVLIEAGNSIHVIHIMKAEDAPIDLAAATPFIKSFFVHSRGKEIVDEKMKKFRQEAKVEYEGDFAVANNTAPTSIEAAAKPVDAAETKQVGKSNNQASVEAGLAGLK